MKIADKSFFTEHIKSENQNRAYMFVYWQKKFTGIKINPFASD